MSGRGNKQRENRADRLALLEAVIDVLPCATIVADAEGRFVVWNEAASALIHRGPASAPTEHWSETFEVFRSDGVTRFESEELPLVRALRGESTDAVPMMLGHPDGPLRIPISVSGRPVCDVEGRVLVGVIVLTDLTERQEFEATLRASEERHRVVIEQTDQLIYDYDIVTGHIHWAGAVQALTGFTADEFASVDIRGWEARIHPDDRERAMALLQDALEGGGQFRVEYRFQRKDGSYVYCEDTGAFVGDGRKRDYRRLLGAMKDVTRRRLAEDARRRLEAQLREAQRLEAIGRLAGGIAHDFNNLLMPILGFTQVLLERIGPEEAGSRELHHIRAAAERARDLTAQLLAFGRRQVLEMQPLDLNAELRRFEPILRSVVREDIELVLDLSPRVDPVRADPAQFERMVLNLIVNARDSISRVGRILVRTANIRLAEGDERMLNDGVQGPCVLLSVSDTGHGIDADTAAKIFEPFFTTKPQGTGLGLATVYGLVRQHGGTITVESQPGRGTTFNLLFPRAQDSEALALGSAAEAAGPTLHPVRHGTVLLAEDESLVRELIVSVLTEHGFRVLVAGDAPQALSLAREFAGSIDLLITDVIMPGMDGRQLHAAISKEREGLAVLYISGYSEEVIANHGVLQAGLHLLQKPFSMKQLLAKINELLDK